MRNLPGRTRERGPAVRGDNARLQRTNTRLARTNAGVQRVAYPLLSGVLAVAIVAASLATPWRWPHVVLYILVAAFLVANVWWIPPRLKRSDLAYYDVAAAPSRDKLGEVARRRARWALASALCFVGGLFVIAATAPLLL
jgi:hypothetical protein